VEGLPAGEYSILISDANSNPENCSEVEINGIELTAPPEILEAQILEIQPVSCFGYEDGSVLAEFFGGLPNAWNWGLYSTDEDGMFSLYDPSIDVLYSYGVNLFEPTQISVNNLPPGYYRLDIYDINGFYVSDPASSQMGLSADLEYLVFNEGCMVSLPVLINEPPGLDVFDIDIAHPCFIYDNVDIDGGEVVVDPANGVLNLNLLGDNPPFELVLVNTIDQTTTSFVSDGSGIQFNDLSAGVYDLFVTDANGCVENFEFNLGWDAVFGAGQDTDGVPSEIFINHLDDDGDGVYDNVDMPDCEFSFDGSIVLPEILNDNDPDFSFTYFWEIDSDADGVYDDISYDEFLEGLSIGLYTLNIIDDTYGCVVVFDYFLQEEADCPVVPTGFSPNGDGINDLWVVGALNQYIDAEVSVYNRWGQRVFYSPNNKEYWDGTHEGKTMPMADYFYIISDIDGDNLSHGRVTLRR